MITFARCDWALGDSVNCIFFQLTRIRFLYCYDRTYYFFPKINTNSLDRTEILRLNDTTIEERVTILEFQVENLNIEVVDQAEDLDRIEGEIVILLEDQVQQNERLLELEIDSDGLCTGFTIWYQSYQINTTVFNYI